MAAGIVQYDRSLESSGEIFRHRKRPPRTVESPITKRPSVLFVSFRFSLLCVHADIDWNEILPCSLTIGFTLCSVIFLCYCPTIPPEWRNLFLQPNITVASVLACRLFRELKLGLFMDSETEGAISGIVFQNGGKTPHHQRGGASGLRTYDGAAETDTSGTVGTLDVENTMGWDASEEDEGHRQVE